MLLVIGLLKHRTKCIPLYFCSAYGHFLSFSFQSSNPCFHLGLFFWQLIKLDLKCRYRPFLACRYFSLISDRSLGVTCSTYFIQMGSHWLVCPFREWILADEQFSLNVMCSSVGKISLCFIFHSSADLGGLEKISGGKQWYLNGNVLDYFLIWPGQMLKL